MGNSMGRQRSRSAGSNVLPTHTGTGRTAHAETHEIAYAETRPLGLVDKHSRVKDSVCPYPHHISNVQRSRPHNDNLIPSVFLLIRVLKLKLTKTDPQRHPHTQPMLRSILRVHERTSNELNDEQRVPGSERSCILG
jgi:hypothetical protein